MQRPTGLLPRLRAYFLTGLAVVLPAAMTVFVLNWVIGFIDGIVVPILPDRYHPENLFGARVAGIGLLVFLVFTTAVGWLTKGFIGRRLLGYGEQLVERMPVVRTIYMGVKQIVETALNQSATSFQTACLVEYPRKGIWAVAFISAEAKGEVATKTPASPLVSVFLPTTPNPTSGFLLFVPREDVIILDMSVEEAAKLVISAGLVVPPGRPAVLATGTDG